MEISNRIDRDRYNLHKTNPVAYHCNKVKWDFFGTLTFLTGGMTALLMLGAAGIGGSISGSAEKYSLCAECRTN